MQQIDTSWFSKALGLKPKIAEPIKEEQPQVISEDMHYLGVDRAGEGVQNPIRNARWHCLILGATGTGKTTLARELVRNVNAKVIWAGGTHPDLIALKSVIHAQERFDYPVLVVFDDAHLHAEHLELIELIARDGLKSAVTLLITAQLIADLPQSVWRNCQARFGLGSDGFDTFSTQHEEPDEFDVCFSWPNRNGVFQLRVPNQIGQQTEEFAGNPLIRRASTPQSAPYEESALARQIPLDRWSKEELAALPDLLDRQLGSKDLPHRTRYSRTL
jgi:Cdc6-like AAA superfamily ATPase